MSNERRKNNRVPVHCLIQLATSNPQSATLADLSLGGCFINTDVQMYLGQQFDLSFTVLGRAVRGTVVVRWFRAGVGFGTQFMRLSLHSSQNLHSIVHCLRGDRSPIPEAMAAVSDD